MIVRIDRRAASREIGENRDTGGFELELPGLGVVARCGKRRVAHENLEINCGVAEIVVTPDFGDRGRVGHDVLLYG